MRILLVEDETALAEALAYILKKHNFSVDLAFDGQTGQDLAETGVFDLIILDRMLPKKEGVQILKEIRTKGIEAPVLLLTARDSIEDRVEGLNSGADDYLIKPFAMEELLARVKALGRRQHATLVGEVINFSGVVLDPLHCTVSCGPETAKLTLKEAQLLELLMRHPGQVITKEQILDRVWGLDRDVELNNVEIYIHYLRKKLNPQAVRIETIRGIGYCLREGQNVP